MLLIVALLGAGVPVSAVHAQGAGDQQYEDPFGGSGSGGGSGGSGSGGSGSGGSGNSNSGSGEITPITPAPQTSGGSSGGSGSASSSSGTAGAGQSGTASPSPSSPAATGTLPNTGLDTRVVVLAGVVLVLVGVGLRLRNAPERF